MSWLDGSGLPTLSADGSTLVFTETAEGGGPARGVFLRKVGAESAIRLGDGKACSLSPDEKWVLSLLPGPPPELVLLPTGAGAARKIALPGLTIVWGFILPDGRRSFVRASEPGKPIGIWILPLEEGKPRLVLPEMSEEYRAASSPDGKRIAFHMGGGKCFILSLEGGERIPLRGLEAGDDIAQWSEDRRYLFAYHRDELPGKIFRIEIETGRRGALEGADARGPGRCRPSH